MRIFDHVDKAIILALQQDARLSNRALAQRVHLSPSSCHARVRRLQESGVLTGFRAEFDLAKLGRPLEAVIAIRYHHAARARVETFLEEVMLLPETLSLLHVTGADDYLLHVAVKDTAALRSFVLDSLLKRPEVEHVETSIVFERRTATTVRPVE